ncbi:hypothetical protein CLV33_10732 [Jejuia pallidilutea]|uniref:Uncharacterized protein n=1 Tax=Jejuia pallidilutea TaxID=504487 RepID=A0A362X4H7_9FLAO|nr:thioredoxin family protein [Jejuia pallidilutea]PQV47250.1 hypothetical protein CLV33_10732 [Jejuia pallidilutea]
MKNIIILIVAFSLVFISHTQNLNKEIALDGETPFLLGKIDKTGLTSINYKSWFNKNYNTYLPQKAIIEAIGTQLNTYNITLFMGTWCGDSKLEVPRFYKIITALGYPEHKLTVIAVSRKPYMYKKSPNHEEAGLNIHRVPTFIFYKNGKEINRIVEHPVESLEKDILKIITSNNYQSNYQIVSKIDNILKNDGLNGFKKQQKKLAKIFKNKVDNMFELNTYGNVLYTINETDEAIEVFKLNNTLFPNNPITHINLSNILVANNKTHEAVLVLKKAMRIFPDNKDLVENLQAIQSKQN